MKVLINNIEVEYESDYPLGWKFSAGDPFKFPVLIDEQQCFIKRFEQKSPKNISGWDLLVKMTGKFNKNLSTIYDIKKLQEKDKEIYYVFYEFLNGSTLDKYVRNGDINLSQISSDLFSAIRSLQAYDFWFADFCEKNIFCQKDGTFVLVDVDSAQPISEMPDNEMYGSKDYWILVFKFYKEILNKNNIRLSDINGISFNYLQIAFLILRLKIFKEKRKDYNSTELYNQLPEQLNVMAPEFKDIFLKIYNKGKQALTENDTDELLAIVEKRIIKTENIKDIDMATVNLPVIKEFNVSSTEVGRGGEFTLSWQVENVNKLELHKNGAMFRTLDLGKTSITLTGFADGTRQQSSYQLIAYKDLAMAKSDPVIIKLKETSEINETIPVKDKQSGKGIPKKVFGIAAGLLAVIAALFVIFHGKPAKTPYIKQEYFWMGIDSAITIYGRNLPPQEKLIVLFNDTKGKVIARSKDSLLVLLPKTQFTASDDSVFVFINFNNKVSHVGKFIILPPVELKQRDIYEDSIITFSGKRLNSNGIKVFLADKEIPLLSQTENELTVKAPKLEDTIHRHVLNLMIQENNKTIFSKNCMVFNDSVDLTKLAPKARLLGAVLLPDGNNTTGDINLTWPGDPNNSFGYARFDNIVMEDNKTYPALRMHPRWLSNGTLKGFFPWKSLRGKKTFKAQIGFLRDGHSTDGVTFQVWVHYKVSNTETWEPIVNIRKLFNQNLINVYAELPKRVSNEFSIELRVDAGNESNSDWAAWINPKVVSRRLRVMPFREFDIHIHDRVLHDLHERVLRPINP